jgi:hypothetical protein
METLTPAHSLFASDSLQDAETVEYSTPQGSWLFDSQAWDD